MLFSITSPLLFIDLFKRLPPEFNSDLFNACVSNAEIEACAEYLALFTPDSTAVLAVVDLLQLPLRIDDAVGVDKALEVFNQIAEDWELSSAAGESGNQQALRAKLVTHPLIHMLREIGDFELWMKYTKTFLGEVTDGSLATLEEEIEQLLRVQCTRELLRNGYCPFTVNYVETSKSAPLAIRNYLDVYCAAAAKTDPRDTVLGAYVDYWLELSGEQKGGKQATVRAVNKGFTEAFGPKFASEVAGVVALIPIEFQPRRKIQCLDEGIEDACRKLIESYFEKISSAETSADLLEIGPLFLSRFVRLMEEKVDIHHVRILLRSAGIPVDMTDLLKNIPARLTRFTERYEAVYKSKLDDGQVNESGKKASAPLRKEAGLLLNANFKLFVILAELGCAVPTDLWTRLSEAQSPSAAIKFLDDALRLIRRAFVLTESLSRVSRKYAGSGNQPPVSRFPVVLSSFGRRLKNYCEESAHCMKEVLLLLPETTLRELDALLDGKTLEEALDFAASNSIAIIEATRSFEDELNKGVEDVSAVVRGNFRRVRTSAQALWTRALTDRAVLLSDDKFQEIIDVAASSADGEPTGSLRTLIVDEVNSLFREELLKAQDEESICAICTEDLFSEECEYLLCSHGFHSQCLDDWWQVRQLCPLCRKKSIRN